MVNAAAIALLDKEIDRREREIASNATQATAYEEAAERFRRLEQEHRQASIELRNARGFL